MTSVGPAKGLWVTMKSPMRVPFYNIQAQYTDLAERLDSVVHEVLSSGAYSMGKYHAQFEKEFAEAHQAKHAIAVNSGTDALRILMDAAGIGPGDEVLTTAFTFVASVETIVQTGAKPVFVDIDAETFMIDFDKVEAAITPKTKAILPIHLFGQLCDVNRLGEIARKHNLIVLEDAAQAVATAYQGKLPGAFGLGAGFSFYVTKNLGAAGDGGMIVTNDDGMAERCRSIRVHGMGRERYYYDHLGYTSRLHEIQAAILSVKMTKLADWNAHRQKVAEVYLSELAGTGIGLPKTLEGNQHTYHQFSIRTDRRDELQAFLKANEIDSMIYYPVPIHYHEPYKAYGHGEGSLPVTEKVSHEVLSLPCHQHLSLDAAAHVCGKIKEFASAGAAV